MSYLLIYAFVIGAIVLIREYKQKSTLGRFLIADRKVGGTIGSMSIAASWIWAPAIFISSQTGFRWGYSGLVWFIIPNMLALILFAPLANHVRKTLPEGYNYIEFLRGGSPSFLKAQLYLQLTMQIAIFAIQLVAGAELLAKLTGAQYSWLVIGMALTPLSYTLFSGLRTSVFTDALQYVVIAVSALIILVAFPYDMTVVDSRPFQPFDPSVLFDFGLSSAAGLLVAIFADNQQWQRAFAIKEGAVVKTFYKAAVFHGIVTTALGVLGILIFNSGFQPTRPDLVGFEYVQNHYGALFVPIFVVMAMCALISTLDSALCAFSSLALKEVSKGTPSLANGRKWMILLVALGLAVALLRPSLITLWFLASTIRLSSFFPVVASIVWRKRPDWTYTLAMVTGLTIGGAIFATGVATSNSTLRTSGMLLTVVFPGLVLGVSLLASRCRLLQPIQCAD